MKRKFIVASQIYGQDAGMIFETFQDVVDEIELPEGYNQDYKIDQLDNGEVAGQFFVMTDDNQPIFFITFSLVKDGESIDILNDSTVYDTLVTKVRDYVDSLGDLSQYEGRPDQEIIELTTDLYAYAARLDDRISDTLASLQKTIDYARNFYHYGYDAESLDDVVAVAHQLEELVRGWHKYN